MQDEVQLLSSKSPTILMLH